MLSGRKLITFHYSLLPLYQILNSLLDILDSLRTAYDIIAAVYQEELWNSLNVIEG